MKNNRMVEIRELRREWLQQSRVLLAASKDDGMTEEQRDLSIGVAKGLRHCAKDVLKLLIKEKK